MKANGFKNLEEADLSPHRYMNILYGSNAQGKTNFIESVWVCTGCRSFRGTKERDYVGFKKPLSEIKMEFCDSERQQSIVIRHDKAHKFCRNMALNGVNIKSLSQLFGSFEAVVFTPEDLELSKGSPDSRRNYMNTGISQLKKSYHIDVVNYNRAIMHRNVVIKNINLGLAKKSDLDIWDTQLARFGAAIVSARCRYIRDIAKKAELLYDDISSGKEKLELYYLSSVFRDVREYGEMDFCNPLAISEIRRRYEIALNRWQDSDIKSGMTVNGVHRDEIITKIDGVMSREFGSQGQSRSIALVMKLAQAQLIEETIGEAPVVLLDDVLSELDPQRQEFVLRRLDGFQVFVTCCDRASAMRFGEGKIFYVENGKITEEVNQPL